MLRPPTAPAADAVGQAERVQVGQEAPLFDLESLDGSRLGPEQPRGQTIFTRFFQYRLPQIPISVYPVSII